MDDRTPVLVGAGVAAQRAEDPSDALEAVALMRRALDAAIADAGQPRLGDRVDEIIIPEGTWSYRNPGPLVLAGRSVGARTVVADVGVIQQAAFSRAAAAIADGRHEVVAVAGGDTKFRTLRAEILGVHAVETPSPEEPDERLRPELFPLSDIEIRRGLAQPSYQYAIIESALRHDAGRTPHDHLGHLADLVARFSQVAATNPDAWNRTPLTAPAVAASAMVAEPYTKPCCAQWNVDQASAFLLCSVETARSLGVATDRWVFPWAAAESNHMCYLPERAALGRCPAIAEVGAVLAELGGRPLADIELVEAYSCYPSAVQLQCLELGIDPARELTVTGGMHFAGGPLNSFSFQALAALVPLLRTDPRAVALNTSVSGMMTKFGAGLWSASPPPAPFRAVDVADTVRQRTATLPVDPDFSGPATVAGYTVGHANGLPAEATVIADTGAGSRAVATTRDTEVIAVLRQGEWVGRTVRVDGVTLMGPQR